MDPDATLAGPKYQGWTNHATWAVHLWLANDYATYVAIRTLAKAVVAATGDCVQVRDRIWTEAEARTFLLADRLKALLHDGNPIADQASAYADLLTSALDDVDWEEIAVAFLDGLAT